METQSSLWALFDSVCVCVRLCVGGFEREIKKKKKSEKERKKDFRAPQLLSTGLSLWPEEIGGLEDCAL